MIPKLEVKGADREFGLYVDDQLVGTSKLDCDARMQMHFLEKKFQEARQEEAKWWKANSLSATIEQAKLQRDRLIALEMK